jgi:cysteine sulfinate desulfinase/cysteine desulfurase-like protein
MLCFSATKLNGPKGVGYCIKKEKSIIYYFMAVIKENRNKTEAQHSLIGLGEKHVR